MVKNIIDVFLGRKGAKSIPSSLRFLRNTEDLENVSILGEFNENLYSDFEDTIFENYSSGHNIQIFAPEDYRDIIKDSNRVYEDAVEFYDFPSINSQIADLLSQTAVGDRTAVFGNLEYLEQLHEKAPEDKIIGFYRE